MSTQTETKPDDNIVNKVRALLKKTETAGCTPEESEAAMRAAAKLMAKHNIDRVVVENAEAASQARKLNLITGEFDQNRDECHTDRKIMRILRDCFGVLVYYAKSYNFEARSEYRKAQAKYEADMQAWMTGSGPIPQEPKQPKFKRVFIYTIVGDKPDVDLAGALIPEFRRIMRFKYTEWMDKEGATWNAADSTSFFDGFAAEYIRANQIAVKEAMLEAGETARDQYALAVVDKEKAVSAYAEQNIQTVRGRRGAYPGARSGYNYSAHKAGQSSAKNLNLKDRRLA